MKYIVFSFIFTCLLIKLVTSIDDTDNNEHIKENTVFKNLIKLKEDHLVILKGEINDQSTAKFISDIHNINEDDIYIFITSPGGSIIHGYQIIQIIKALTLDGKIITCIGDIANSMGFAILQSCQTRYVTVGSVIMQHQMSFGVDGPIENVRSRIKLIEEIEQELVQMESSRLGLSVEEFNEKITSDWWAFGKKAVQNNMADQVVNIICDFDFKNKTYSLTVPSFFGDINLEYSICPLIRNPTKITLELRFDKNNTSDKVEDITQIDEIKNKYYFDF